MSLARSTCSAVPMTRLSPDCECELPVTVAGDELRVGSTVIAEKTWDTVAVPVASQAGAYARYCLGVSDIVLTRKK